MTREAGAAAYRVQFSTMVCARVRVRKRVGRPCAVRSVHNFFGPYERAVHPNARPHIQLSSDAEACMLSARRMPVEYIVVTAYSGTASRQVRTNSREAYAWRSTDPK